MYLPGSFRQDDPEKLFALIEAYNFGILFGTVNGEPFATHIPFMLDREGGENGTLIAHMARANPHWKSLEASTALVVFQGPHHYISPSWYASTGNVSTWNYATVHVYGRPELVHDPSELHALVSQLMNYHERAMPRPSAVPDGYPIDSKLKAIVGIRIPIDRMEGKFKLNQNKTEADRRSVMGHLDQTDHPDLHEMARLMRQEDPD